MASGPGSRAGEQPPELPVKQHRSHSFRLSSAESDCVVLSPDGPQHQNHAYNDVFPEPTDCQAAECPIHQRYDASQHQMRFFSDGTPPPVPKKRLARTTSLPGANAPPCSPLSPLQRHPQNFDNPLYMLAPIHDAYFDEETEGFTPARGSPAPSPSFSQLTFDTPDEHLCSLFSGIDDQRVVFQGIQRRHLVFLRNTAQSVEAATLLRGQAVEGDVGSYRPQDFLLCEGSEPKRIRGAVYHSLRSPAFPGRVLGLRVHKQSDGAPAERLPSHVNVQDVIAHFQRGKTLINDPGILQTQDPSRPSASDRTAAEPPAGGSAESAVNLNLTSVQAFLQRGHSVSVVRDLPHATLEDFVEESAGCLDFDRQLCVLFLQILMGSQHLYNTSATAAELRPQEVLLVWPNREREAGEIELQRDASETKRGFNTSRAKGEMERVEKEGKFQVLWRAHGSPRVVLTPRPSALSVPQALTCIKSQIGALIQHCLDPHGSLTSLGSVPIPFKSPYRAGLLYLASVLQSKSSGPQMADMVATLQVLLWGPRVPLFNRRGPMTAAMHNWLTIKRALLVMKLAERGLTQDQRVLDWEDCMCLRYLSFTDPETVVSVTSRLWLTPNVD